MSNILMPSFDEVRHKIEKALRLLYKNDLFLITNTTNERSITHKLAEYIQILFPEWHVDCEYNRKGEDIKRLYSIDECSEQRKTNRIIPDIIIHHRCMHNNLLVIETKVKNKSDNDDICDRKKLQLLTQKDGEYGYEWGLYIQFHHNEENKIKKTLTWYANGDQLNENV
jgi:hypothetical protein